jgi:threonine/homoserine/homoserine lactone efflux protein
MFGIENYLLFLISGIILNITPGNDTIYILTRTISQSKKAGIFSVLGIINGCLIHTLLASFGLTIILKTSSVLYAIIKYLGVLYLIYLGIKTIIQKEQIFEIDDTKKNSIKLFKIYYQGLLTNLFNPKVTLFFLSFLPQFIKSEAVSSPIPFLLLGLTFITTGTLWCLFLVFISSFMTKKLKENNYMKSILQKLTGVIFIGLGLKILFEKKQ